MKRLTIIATLAAAFISTSALAADVGVSISVGQHGFYGRIDIGDFPPPQVIYHQPRVILLDPMNRQPVYLRVPPGHAKHWGKHCHEYNACSERVYFVQDNWYQREYVPRYQKQYRDRQDGRGDDHHEYQKNEHRNHGRDNDHGRDR